MTLTNRLLSFFLTALAVLLLGFSVTLYLLVRSHLNGQLDDRLEATLNTLVAAVEVRVEAVEWEPSERLLSFGAGADGGEVAWLVTDEQGQVVDRAGPPDIQAFLADAAGHLRTGERPPTRPAGQDGRWQLRQRRVRPHSPDSPAAAALPPPDEGGRKYAALAITAGVAVEPVRATLDRLLGALAGLALGVWCVALVAGRAVCRRALLPVSRMAASARAMNAADLRERLPAVATGDELDDLGRAFNGLLDRLQESFERQRRFTGDASHQLRTPLTAILGQIEVALRRERPAEEYRRVMATVQQKAGHLKGIVEALLFLARANADARLPERERVDLSAWLPEHLRLWSAHPRAGDIVPAEGGDGSVWVEVQPALLGELVDILLDNACKHSPPETPITAHLSRDGRGVCVAVEDRGYGIGEDDLPHVFTPFYRSADARRRGVDGVGLGLSIAQRLAGAFGGALTVRSVLGRGSCFTLRLPAAEPAAAADAGILSGVELPTVR